MMKKMKLWSALMLLITSALSYADTLDGQQKKELTLFGMKAMGLNVGIDAVKKVLSLGEVEEMVSTGLNLNGLLCAKIVEVRPLKVPGIYEASCIAYRGGTATKTYVLDTSKGTAFVP